jgi:hypothetical protein
MAMKWLRRTRADGRETACCPECEAEVDTALTYCAACGYDIVQQARIDTQQGPRPV